MDRRSFYLGALLHDIGKFIERTKNDQRQEKAKHWISERLTDASYAHRRYGADFVDEFCRTKPHLLQPEVVRCILFHHRGNDSTAQDHDYLDHDVYVKIIRLADSLAASEREENAKYTPQDYFKAKLLSIFSQVRLNQNKGESDRYLEIKKLSLKETDLFPNSNASQEPATIENAYRTHVDEFEQEFKLVQNDIQLYYLLEKYLWAVPATPYEINDKEYYNKPDVSLFDHSRVTAAIALCLYDEHQAENLRSETLFAEKNGKTLPRFALLVNVDLSGIQSFIFDIPSKGAAKSLKGRSFYLQLLAEIIARHLLDRLNLPICNLLYDGGGNLFLLVPKCKEEELTKRRKEIVTILAEEHHGAIYAAIGWVDLAGKDFGDFGLKWKEAVSETAKIKRNRFCDIDYQHIFEPQALEQKHDFKTFTEKIKTAKTMMLCRVDSPEVTVTGKPEAVFARLGYEITFHTQTEGLHSDKDDELYIFNNTDFLPKFSGFKFSAVNVPARLEFDKMARAVEKGDKNKLALLKMDVDNLGKIFISGLPENERSISRLATLSRMFRLFFEGYLNTLREEVDQQNRKIYIVYAGGDDTFLFGAWDAVFDLAELIRTEFKAYVCGNDDINLSASLTLMHYKFPVIRAAEVAENTLHKAKRHILKCEQEASKNKIAILGEVFTWREFEYIKDFKDILLQLIDSEDAGRKESRALLQKVYNSTRGFSNLLEQTNNGKIHLPKFWRFAYYLRNMKNANKEQKEKLVEIYEAIIKSQIYKPMNEKVHNAMIIPVAARWAEMATRKSDERRG